MVVGRSDMKITRRVVCAAIYLHCQRVEVTRFFYLGNFDGGDNDQQGIACDEQIRCREIRVIDEQGSADRCDEPSRCDEAWRGKGLTWLRFPRVRSHRFAVLWIMANIAMNRTRRKRETRKNPEGDLDQGG